MKRFLIAYAAGDVVFIAIDLLWLCLVMSKLFKAQMPQLILQQPKLEPATVSYALYPIGIVVFGVLPVVAAHDWVRAAAMSALFGLLAYVTYEMTNLATLKGWSAQIALIDIAWGAALSGARCHRVVRGACLGRWLAQRGTDRAIRINRRGAARADRRRLVPTPTCI